MNCQIKKILKKKPHLAPVPSGYLESLLNYVDIYEASNEESSEEDTSVTGEEDTASTTSTCSRREYSNMFENIKEPAGAWGTHRFEEHPWSDYDRPSVKLEEYENLILDDEKLGILTDPIISSSLSYLERSPYDLKYVLCKCILSHKLLKDISALKYYHYIQYLDLSRNKLTTLAPLGQLPFLQHLNASHNHIRKLLDFKAPFYLSFVDFSHNLIRTIPDLTEFWSLTQLNVSNNGIIKISGLEKLRYLNYLDLSHNKIVTLENLNNLRIQFLILHHNAIDNIEEKNNMDLKTLCYIRSVDLSNNNLSSLKIFQIAENVENIDMSTNKISSLLELYYLKNLRYLSTLNLSNNPVSEIDFYFNVCLIMIKNLMKLDGEEITAEDRIKIKRNDEIDPLFHAGESHIDLILLQQINHPCIGAHIIPYDQPPPIVFILVGPPGSRKREIVKMICSRNKKCVYGVSHTTRPRTDDEIDGEDYYFVSNEEFKSLTRKGQFIAVSEFNGYSFGIVHEELKKCEDRILFFHSNIHSALSLKLMGINPKLVLAMPKSEKSHLEWLKMKYFYDTVGQGIFRVKNCPEDIKKLAYGNNESRTSVIRDNLSIVEHIIEKVLDLKENEILLQDMAIFTRTSADTAVSESITVDVKFQTDGNDPRETSSEILKQVALVDKDTQKTSFNDDSLTAYSFLKEKCDSKKTSVTNFSQIDICDDQCINIDQKSVSETIVSHNESVKKENIHVKPFLSVLSSNELNHDADKETVKMTEKFDLMQNEKLKTFFKKIVESRTELLELHWSNPGLFREIIFTDEVERSLGKLKVLIKLIVENYKSTKPLTSMEDDQSYINMVTARLGNLDVQEVKNSKINWNIMHECTCESTNIDDEDV